ncbi:MAG TPA: molybdopterin molybdotransferase MoeA, partial [Candidatus Caenarcaniphilales bacterium]|nr:molybdopterin molybdotransferase MoeA [Candidatus Caenarcaniphilales bacterium]
MTTPAAAQREELLSLEEASRLILDGVTPLAAEQVDLGDALGRVLAQPLVSLFTLPPWDNSAMDGFAVRAADVESAARGNAVTLRVVGEVAAGHLAGRPVEPGTALRILTGAPLPSGADAVVPVEDTDAQPGSAALPATVAITRSTWPGEHVRRAGSDLRAGQPLLAAGTDLRPAHLAIAAAGGHGRLSVHRRPRVAVLATGDELAQPGDQLGPAQIPDSNSVGLVAQA